MIEINNTDVEPLFFYLKHLINVNDVHELDNNFLNKLTKSTDAGNCADWLGQREIYALGELLTKGQKYLEHINPETMEVLFEKTGIHREIRDGGATYDPSHGLVVQTLKDLCVRVLDKNPKSLPESIINNTKYGIPEALTEFQLKVGQIKLQKKIQLIHHSYNSCKHYLGIGQYFLDDNDEIIHSKSGFRFSKDFTKVDGAPISSILEYEPSLCHQILDNVMSDITYIQEHKKELVSSFIKKIKTKLQPEKEQPNIQMF